MISMEINQSHLVAALQALLAAEARNWLDQSLALLAQSNDLENDLLTRSSMAGRKLGPGPLGPCPTPLQTSDGPFDCAHWSLSDGGRIVLLMQAMAQDPPANTGSWAERLFRSGDESERAAVVKGLALLPDPGSLKHLALEAGRCNSLRIYSAMALKNPYIRRWYDEHEYNQVVLKSLFTGLSIEYIHGLRERANAELSRMCEQYADERIAAGRTVPVDIWLAIAPHAGPHGRELMLLFLQDPDPGHRYYSAIALGQCAHDPDFTDALRRQLAVEDDSRVRDAIERQLAH